MRFALPRKRHPLSSKLSQARNPMCRRPRNRYQMLDRMRLFLLDACSPTMWRVRNLLDKRQCCFGDKPALNFHLAMLMLMLTIWLSVFSTSQYGGHFFLGAHINFFLFSGQLLGYRLWAPIYLKLFQKWSWDEGW